MEIVDGGRIAALMMLGLMAGAKASSPAFATSGHGAHADIAGVDVAGMDTEVAAGDDFFRYANGTWLKTAVIPPDRSNWGVGGRLEESADRRTKSLIERSGGRGAPHPVDGRKVADYYAAFMDEATIEKRGLTPLDPELARIAAISDRQELARWLGATLRADVDVLNNTVLHTDNLFGIWIAQDLDRPEHYAPFLIQGGLDLPDREYYLSDTPQMVEIQAKYRAHIASVLKLSGSTDPEGGAQRVYELERRIASAHESRTDSEDVKRGDNHWTFADLSNRAPGLDWHAFFVSAGIDSPEFIVWQPQAVTGIAALAGGADLDTWRTYLRFHLLEHASHCLPKAYVEENFRFFGAVLHGTPTLRERWKRGVAATDAALGEALGRLYVERYFPADAKARIEVMVRQLLAAYAVRIDRLTWMLPETRAKAKAKLSALRIGIGYPDHWRDYADLDVVRGDAYGNFQRAERFELRYHLRKLGRPVDRSEWVTYPQVVNAFNLPAMNAINFPAAILQPPFFDVRNSPAANYGALGATIGHEISHSFDDQGALFGADGRYANWWTPADLKQFKEAAARLARQYGLYRPLPDAAVNGRLTLSENIADVAGLAAAFDAYHSALAGKPAPSDRGFSGDQQFFISFGQSFRDVSREPALREQLITDAHSPDEYRADTVRNLDAWYGAFPVRSGQRLYLAPADRVTVW